MDFIKKHWLAITITVVLVGIAIWKRREIAEFLGMGDDMTETKPTTGAASKPDPIPQAPGVSGITPATI